MSFRTSLFCVSEELGNYRILAGEQQCLISTGCCSNFDIRWIWKTKQQFMVEWLLQKMKMNVLVTLIKCWHRSISFFFFFFIPTWKYRRFSSCPNKLFKSLENYPVPYFSFFGNLQTLWYMSSIGQVGEVAVSNVQLALYFTMCFSQSEYSLLSTAFWEISFQEMCQAAESKIKRPWLEKTMRKNGRWDGSDQQSLELQPDHNYLPESCLMVQ